MEFVSQPVNPFLKWAGGKRWLVNNYDHLLPKKFNNYIEPFLGSGAVYFHMRPRQAILSDLNQDLISTYESIKSDWKLVNRYLVFHSKHHSKDYYYKVREESPRSKHRIAANLIYLNRTCWNGLYRVNLAGKFNVPVGTKTNVLDGFTHLKDVSEAIKHAKFQACDFEKTINLAMANDFLFVDPPYLLSNNSSFVKYNQNVFQWSDMERLKEALIRASNRKVKVMITHQFDKKIHSLFSKDFDSKLVQRKNVISGSVQSRGVCQESIFFSNM